MANSIDTNTLLSILGSGVRPIDPVAGGSRTNAGSFDQLLERAFAGSGSSSPATITALPGVDHGLTTNQLASIAALAEQAEAQGATTLAVLDGDRAFTIDVASRTITGVSDITEGVVPGADLIAKLPGASDRALALPGTVFSMGPASAELGLDAANINASLLDALARTAG